MTSSSSDRSIQTDVQAKPARPDVGTASGASMEDAEVRELVGRVEGLLEQIDGEPKATEVVQALVELYGEALARLLAGVNPMDDELLSHLLLVHDLHPVDVETRVRTALDDVRPYLGSHGGDVELLGVEEGVARVRLEGTCNGCPSSTVTLRNAIEDVIMRAAPELERIEAEGVAEAQPVVVPVGALQCPTELESR
jgi:Fe-S cluster biogenesis protein NfuA